MKPATSSSADLGYETCRLEDLPLILKDSLALIQGVAKEQGLDLSLLEKALVIETQDQLPQYRKVSRQDQVLAYFRLEGLDPVELDDFNVLAAFRNQGIGSAILEDLKQSHPQIIVRVRKDHPRAINFYKNHGFSFREEDPKTLMGQFPPKE